MKFRILILLLAILVCFGGCKNQEPQATVYTEPTLPSFDDTVTPQTHLDSAIEGLHGKQLSASYGSGLEENLTMTTTENMDDLRELVPNKDLIAQFSQLGMMVSPSNKGTFQYQLMSLTPAEMCNLLCGRDLTEEEQEALSAYPDAIGTMVIGVDKDGVFQSLKAELPLSESTWMLEIQITPQNP